MIAYSGNLVKINGNVIPHITSYKVSRAKLWKDSERNMSGDMCATLIGIFPKIQLEIGYTTQDDLKELTALLDKSSFKVEWYDVRTDSVCEGQYYASDYDVELDSKTLGRYKPFSVSLVPMKKYTGKAGG